MNGATVPGLGFSIGIDATSDVAFDADRVEALITVAAHFTGTVAPAARIAEVLIMDRSRSMMSHNKILEARRAACAAIDVLPDGALLGIIGGNHTAERVFPPSGGLTPVDAATRTAAKRQVMSLWPEGGTKIGSWLTAANGLFAAGPATGVIRHAVLYSDGKNEHETREALDDALRTCADRFACDVRGLGDDWDYVELLHIAETPGRRCHGGHRRRRPDRRLHRAHAPGRPPGRAPGIPAAEPPPPASGSSPSRRRILSRPTLSPRIGPAGGAVIDVPLGPWEQETRRYQLTLRFEPGSLPVADDLRATPVELFAETADGQLERRAGAALVVRRHAVEGGVSARREWLTPIAKERELTFAIKGCADAWLKGRGADAEDEVNCAIALATELGDVRLGLLRSMTILGPDGRARLRPDVTRGHMLKLALHSVKTGLPAEHVPTPRPPPASGRYLPQVRGNDLHRRSPGAARSRSRSMPRSVRREGRVMTAHPVTVLRWLRNGVLLSLAAAALLYLWVAIQARHEIAAVHRTQQAIVHTEDARSTAASAQHALQAAFKSEDVTLTGTGTDFVNKITQVNKDLTLAAEDNAAGSEGTSQIQYVSGELESYLELSESAVLDYSLSQPFGLDTETYASGGESNLRSAIGQAQTCQQLTRLEQGGSAPAWRPPRRMRCASSAARGPSIRDVLVGAARAGDRRTATRHGDGVCAGAPLPAPPQPLAVGCAADHRGGLDHRGNLQRG